MLKDSRYIYVGYFTDDIADVAVVLEYTVGDLICVRARVATFF